MPRMAKATVGILVVLCWSQVVPCLGSPDSPNGRFEHGANVIPMRIALNPVGNTLVSASNDGRLRVWDFPSGALIRTFVPPHYSISNLMFSDDGTRLASIDSRGRCLLWNSRTWQLQQRIDELPTRPFSTFHLSRSYFH